MLASLAACAHPAPRPDPFLIPPSQLQRLAEPIVLTPTLVPEGLDVPEAVPATIDSLVAATLAGAGVATVPSAAYVTLWQWIQEEIGGIADPTTGARDSLRFADAVELLSDELWQRYRAGSILYIELAVVDAPMSRGKAQWDGATEWVSESGIWADLVMLLRGREPLDGWIEALSLWATVETTGGTELFASSAGIQLLHRLDEGAGEWTPIPSKTIVDKPKRMAAAVAYALEPLVEVLRRPRR